MITVTHASEAPLSPADLDLDLPALCAAAEPWLERLQASDQRIQAAPDSRTIRFYQTTGLLDRPSRYDGRNARYGRRHLLQLIAIRALQTSGLSLSQVQSTLAGAMDSELQSIVERALGGKTDDVLRQALATASLHDPTADLASIHVRAISNPAITNFTAVELAPGVVVIIDSRIHTDIARTIDALRRALTNAASHTASPQGDLS